VHHTRVGSLPEEVWQSKPFPPGVHIQPEHRPTAPGIDPFLCGVTSSSLHYSEKQKHFFKAANAPPGQNLKAKILTMGHNKSHSVHGHPRIHLM
jgi:hypothetical protein